MSKRNKIIVSIVGITIVLLALLGITYAYYLTRIEGNTNTNSISITTAKLELLYGDGNGNINATSIMPGEKIKFKTESDEIVEFKSFTVTNNGNSAVAYNVVLEDVVNNLLSPQDMQMDLECVSSVENKDCYGIADGQLPNTNDTLVENSIEPEEVHTYKLEITYLETGVDQSDDMGKELRGKINIYDAQDTFDLSGNITGFSEGDYVIVQSEPKKSYITREGKYKVVGLKPEEHNISVYSSSGELKGSKDITISKSDENADVLVDNNTQLVNIDVTEIKTELTTSVPKLERYNPFNAGTVAYNIYTNSIRNLNGTSYRDTPITTVKDLASSYMYDPVNAFTYKVASNFTDWGLDDYWTIGTSYVVESDGTFTFTEGDVCEYFEEGCLYDLYSSGVKVYILGTGSWKATSDDGSLDYTHVEYIYEVAYAPSSLDNIEDMKLYTLKSQTISNEKILTKTQDAYGDAYYYRGGVKDNYLEFNNMCWRVVRIQGDGSIKIVLAAEKKCSEIEDIDIRSAFLTTKAPYGYTMVKDTKERYYANYDTYEGGIRTTLSDWYATSGLFSLDSKIKEETWCLGYHRDYRYNSSYIILDVSSVVSKYYYSSAKRLFKDNVLSLACVVDEGIVQSKIGLLSVDEFLYAGAAKAQKNPDFYLTENAWGDNVSSSVGRFYCDSDWCYDAAYSIDLNGELTDDGDVDINSYIRPSIVLKSDVKLNSGDGTKNNPYVVS